MGNCFSNPANQYTFTSIVLGRGTQSVVKKAIRNHDGLELAYKTTIKPRLSANSLKLHHQEIEILNTIGGNEFLQESMVTIEGKRTTVVVQRLMAGGSVESQIDVRQRFSEPEAKHIILSACRGLSHLHSLGIAHRDIKPGNILLEHGGNYESGGVRITDFGLSGRFTKTQPMTKQCGSPDFIAPEIIKGEKYTELVDVWSLGVTLFEMLGGYTPFRRKTAEATYDCILTSKLDFDDPGWKTISVDAKILMKGMMTKDPAHRMSLEQVMLHPWFKSLIKKDLIKRGGGKKQFFSTTVANSSTFLRGSSTADEAPHTFERRSGETRSVLGASRVGGKNEAAVPKSVPYSVME